MAYQSKNHRKFLATSLTAAMVATAVAPAAGFAAEDTKSFPDVSASHWAKDAIDYLVGKGALEGRPDGSFDPTAEITRGEAAKILSITLGLEVSEDAEASFGDLEGHWASKYVAAIEGQTEDVINGYQDGSFKPNNKITRQEMAKMIVTAYELTANEDVTVDFSDNNSWGAEYVTTLASLGVVEGMSEGKFSPQASVTRAQTPVFVHRAEVEEVRVTPVSSELEIVGVSALTQDGKYIEVTFNKSVKSLDKSQVTIQNSETYKRAGVESVELSADGKTATVTLYGETVYDNAGNPIYVLDQATTYTLSATINGEVLSGDFAIAAFNDVRITSADADERILNGMYEIPEDMEFDFEEAIGRQVKIWSTEDDVVTDFEFDSKETVLFDRVEVTKVSGGNATEVELTGLDKEYDVKSGYTTDLNDVTDAFTTVGDTADYAKVVLDKNGEVVYVYAYDWDDSLLVDKVEDNVIYAYGEELDVEDFVIVKDGKTISVDEIQAGDVLFFNTGVTNHLGKKGYAEVFSNTVKGEIEAVYSDGIQIDGKVYDIAGSEYLDGSDLEGMSTSYAEDLEAGGEEVTLYLDRNGDLVFVTGELGESVTNTYSVLLTEAAYAYTSGRDSLVDLEGVDQEGNTVLYTVNVKDLEEVKVNGTKTVTDTSTTEVSLAGGTTNFQLVSNSTTLVDFGNGATLGVPDGSYVGDAVNGSDNDVVKVTEDENGKIVKLEVMPANAAQLSPSLKTSDSYAKITGSSKKLKSSTVVYDLTDASSFTNPDDDDINVTTWGEMDSATINAGTVYYNADGEVTHLVVTSDDAEDTTDHVAVLNDIRTTSGDITRITAWVNGEKKSYSVDKLNTSEVWFDSAGTVNEFDAGTDDFTALGLTFAELTKGSIAKITVDDNTGVITGLRLLQGDTQEDTNLVVAGTPQYVSSVDLGDSLVKLDADKVAGGETPFTFTSGGTVLDVTGDYEVKNLRDVRSASVAVDSTTTTKVTVVREALGADFINYIIIK